MKLSIAYSPCPNDTFMFHDLATGRLHLPDTQIEVHLHDVETLNRMALEAAFDVTKLSFHAHLLVREEYEMLGVGAALGHGCGPVIVARREIAPADLPTCRLAVPGELTTAHLLLRLWAPEATRKTFVRYDRIMDLLASGQADAGVIIHEGRFVFQQAGFHLLMDLGQWWQELTGLPIPLGCIAARRSLGERTIRDVEALLRRAIENSLAHPDRTRDYVRRHAQEMDEAVLAKHIETFVNDYSLDLGEDGRKAIEKLSELARGAGIIP
ncbi:MAG TPA: 1,4-dihydroxy-6-naphthoate synthase [Phycisphaerae bacterium]|nr:1,4-dihydroxy-6-naphthoate synthase [Phycisphaerae bacterium]